MINNILLHGNAFRGNHNCSILFIESVINYTKLQVSYPILKVIITTYITNNTCKKHYNVSHQLKIIEAIEKTFVTNTPETLLCISWFKSQRGRFI